MLNPSVLARIDKLELDATQVVEGYLAGRHKSPQHGFAVEFAQHREYTPGDDIKHLDWKVYARTERYHLKQYEQETNLVAWMIVDASESMKVATTGSSKFDIAATLTVALTHLATRQADSVGLYTFADRLRPGLKPSSNPGQVREVVRLLAEGASDSPSNVGSALRDLGGLLGRRGIVFVFSDLLDPAADMVSGLRILRSQKHEVVLFQVLDAAEIDFPFRHPTLFQGLEALPEISTDPLSVRESYLREFHAHLQEIDALCRSLEIDLVRVRTDDDLGQLLVRYLQQRKRR